MRRPTPRRTAAVVTLVLASLAATPRARAWPPDPSLTIDQLAQPANWPSDPNYGLPTPTSDGEWYLYSWTPPLAEMQPGFHTDEAPLGAGTHTDAAWQVTIGDPRVLLAITDSGIEWDDADLQLKIALNPGELPAPQDATGATLPYDANGDGVFNVADYLNDARVPCGAALPHPLRACQAAGANNDPNGNGVFDAGDLIRIFSDGTDADHDGYTDDIAGWDFFKDDNDPSDDLRYGHGTGEGHDSAAQTNNAIGGAGACPRCMVLPLRAADSFSGDTNDFAQAAVYAADARYGAARARVIQCALGDFDNGSFAMRAVDYAYAHGVAVVTSAADENSRHHNMPGTNNHTIYVHAIGHDGADSQHAHSFLLFDQCSNYGGQLQLSSAGGACSSGATGTTSGITGLIFSEALAAGLSPDLTSEEARQLLIDTADDIDVPTSIPGSAHYDPTLYPSLPGWDQRFGYGRVNSRRAVDAVRSGAIPPEVDVTSPRWFTAVYPDHAATSNLAVTGRIAATRAPSFDYTVEWAPGIEPASTAWTTLRHETAVTAPVTDTLGNLDLSTVNVDNAGEVENRYTITFRVRATAHYDPPIGDVTGEARRVAYVLRDATLLPGYPLDVRASGEGAPHLVDLDGDGHREIVVANADGVVHALEADGTDLHGWPAFTPLDRGFDPAATPLYTAAAAYSGVTPAIDPASLHESVVSAPAIGDLDGDGHPEVVVATLHGHIAVFHSDGSAWGHGFPFALPDVPSSDTSPTRRLDRGVFGAPVLYDLDGDHHPEIIFGALDGRLYALSAATGAAVPGFPVLLHNPAAGAEFNRIVGTVGVGHFDGDAIPDLVAVSDERPPGTGGGDFGTLFLVHGDGMLHAGGPLHPNYPIAVMSQYVLPTIGEGLSNAPAIADVDNDGRDEMAIVGTANASIVVARGEQPAQAALPATSSLDHVSVLAAVSRGRLSDSHASPIGIVPTFAIGAFGDMTNDGVLDYTLGGASLSLAIGVTGTTRATFEHLVGAWDTRTGATLPGFPRVIEDYLFFVNDVVADVNADGYPETIAGSGGYYVHAWDGCGREPADFPKFTGQWVASTVALGDLDGDHALEIAATTRDGWIYAWHTQGRDDGHQPWPTYRHDSANTGNYGATADFGTRHADGVAPLVCPGSSTGSDGGVVSPDAAGSDATAPDAGRYHAGGGCGCRALPTRTGARSASAALTALGLLAAAAARRKRRA